MNTARMSGKEFESKLVFPHIFIVEASAGSGKTYRLARRYLELLFNLSGFKQEDLRNILPQILAITFTNKAAQNMKASILDLLKKIALDDFTNPENKKELMAILGKDSAKIKDLALHLTDFILQNYNLFQIQTIDSFINTILSACAFRLGLSTQFQMKKDFSEYLLFSLDSVIEEASSQDGEDLRLLQNFLQQYLFIENKRSWFPKQDIFKIVQSLYSKSNFFCLDFASSQTETQQLVELKKEFLKTVKKFAQDMPAGFDLRFVKAIDNLVEKNTNGFNLEKISSFFSYPCPPLKKGASCPKQIHRNWEKIRAMLQEIVLQEAFSLYNYYVQIYHRILNRFEEILKEEDMIFLQALNKKARQILTQEQFGLPELYLRLATRFRHFLLDEFQDTSVLQWENLFAMIEEALSTDGSVFYVGDRKQAIYRFRGGESSLIDRVKDTFSKHTIFQEHLGFNYRSSTTIVEFNNRLFSEENLRRFFLAWQDKDKGQELPDYALEQILRLFKNSHQIAVKKEKLGFVCAESLQGKNKKEQETNLYQRLISLIEELRQRFLPSQIAILCRTNEEVKKISLWLLENNIAVESERTLSIRNHPLIKELVSLLKFLNSPIDDLSFASFILGDIFSRASGISLFDIQEFIFRCRNVHYGSKSDHNRKYLYRLFRQEYPKIWEEYLEVFFRSVGFIPLYEFLVSILVKFNCLHNFPQAQGFFMRLLELIKTQEAQLQSLGRFLDFFEQAQEEELFVSNPEGQAIRVMTIHKAKGLEFNCVVIPALQMDIRVENQLVLLDDEKLRLVHLKKKYAEFSLQIKTLRQEEYLRSFIDELCTVYVAMTRAIDELYIFFPQYLSGRSFNPVVCLFPEANLELGKKSVALPDVDGSKQNTVLVSATFRDWVVQLKQEWQDIAPLNIREEIVEGTIMHYILSQIKNVTPSKQKEIIEQAIRKAETEFFYHRKKVQECKKKVESMLEDNRLRPYFQVADTQVETEKEIVTSHADTLRVDRVVVFLDKVVLLDYKRSHRDQDEHRLQMKGYIEAFKEIYPQKEIKGILVYLDDMDLQEVV